ncbi:HAD family hydrolase [Streptomyces johnsoniae]|uniref:HAD-IA family hydrolase n=1 Tax=Streptomyces johnsoniae TaxID=3075532 RepID=A0ABU2SBV7_9ACTN|nr:HAD-IA family hydrolase [Streptomyces sp. DSM 41886]MDT0446457.1 HAD-IA family hydrolase [Streptomyces sp. DSM 41886]
MTAVAVFDLDGTLIDTPRGIVATFTAVFDSMGLEWPDPAAVRATIGIPLERAFGQLLPDEPEDAQIDEAIRRHQRYFAELVLPRAGQLLFPGVVAGLAALRAQGVGLAVATSKFHAGADALLTAAGLRAEFDVVIGADQVTHPKPHPQTGLAVLSALRAVPEEAVMVGDTTHDLLMAKACGMRSIAVTYGVHGARQLRAAGATWLADTFDDVLAHLAAARRGRPAAPAW